MSGNKGRWIGGSMLVTVGVLFMLQQWGFLHFNIGDLVSIFWPLILLFVGVSMLVSGTWAGLIVLGIGGFFLLSNLGIIHMSLGEAIRRAFPLIIIAVGLIVLFGVKGKFKTSKHKEPEWNPSTKSTEWKKPEYEDPFADYVKNLNAEQNPISNDVEGNKEHGGVKHVKINIPKHPKPPTPPHYTSFSKKNKYDDDLDLDFDLGDEDDDYDYDDDDYSGQGDYDYKTYKKKLKHSAKKLKKKKDEIEKSCFIGDIHLGHDYWELRPSSLANFIGDTIIDLTKAQVPYGKTSINVSSFIGDVKVYVPNDIELGVFVSSHSFLGDMKVFDQKYSGFMRDLEAKTPFFHESSKKVLIEVNSFIGDVKVIRVG
ncbi:cell wall-active antibiotics response protein LiaF [Paenibacillus agilis]|uniref:Cell wall-active antibiotics response protein n=1 Tax=Paenibacillus agilis TaxID=3020863 RepID=A0A559IWY8_9BACL|nr:cell wall-active antibiotics response protein LiaF [Paenibacillus agilis]TVX92142.1 cell wall-active antibiotics response protein [Paenibacillus agilis]